MALRNIRTDNDEILRKRSRDVAFITDRIKMILDDMLETLKKEDGIGLAAPQIGILKRLVVIDFGDENKFKMINPRIIKEEGESIDEEGCLSIPGVRGKVKRPEKIVVAYVDENSKKLEMEAEGLLARCICHEIDHLNGILFTDKML